MIVTFRQKRLAEFFAGKQQKEWATIRSQLHNKLAILDAAAILEDLRVPPGNRLEKLVGDRAGQHSIRVNDQFRLCFHWTTKGPKNVEIVDYH